MTVNSFVVSRTRAGRAPRDNSVVLVLIVMMGIVFGPVIGVHAVAALGAAPPASAPSDAASVVQPATRSPG